MMGMKKEDGEQKDVVAVAAEVACRLCLARPGIGCDVDVDNEDHDDKDAANKGLGNEYASGAKRRCYCLRLSLCLAIACSPGVTQTNSFLRIIVQKKT